MTQGRYDKCGNLKEALDSGLESEVHMGIIYIVFIYSCIYLGFAGSPFSPGACFRGHAPLCLLYLPLLLFLSVASGLAAVLILFKGHQTVDLRSWPVLFLNRPERTGLF